MDYRGLGSTGMQVSPLCLGAMMFGDWGNPDHDESVRIIHRALDAGINFIDTADVYARGESEEIVGKALADGKVSLTLRCPDCGAWMTGPFSAERVRELDDGRDDRAALAVVEQAVDEGLVDLDQVDRQQVHGVHQEDPDEHRQCQRRHARHRA